MAARKTRSAAGDRNFPPATSVSVDCLTIGFGLRIVPEGRNFSILLRVPVVRAWRICLFQPQVIVTQPIRANCYSG